MQKRLLTVAEAVDYQRVTYGRVAYGRDALYTVAKAGLVPVIRVGRRRIFIPISAIDELLRGTQHPVRT
ncbi:hypothetical protein E7T06_05250 [Deinococcus sp. Arct2-2]|uniref:hypothetical protein n=1 Tax=Deinococcus sp. Arct2-2 TaxID=2568653 RepID=UPI0010A4D268|nr:hypothetical protein [Deinococcus sp. Arct2-2]THF70963.1 hypothetical protein E7T06_05250 [Deinococcus sp. Arct2-2]